VTRTVFVGATEIPAQAALAPILTFKEFGGKALERGPQILGVSGRAERLKSLYVREHQFSHGRRATMQIDQIAGQQSTIPPRGAHIDVALSRADFLNDS
jgi:hypothetical protein